MRLSNLLLVILLIFCVSAAVAGPELRIRNERFDMGSIPDQNVVGHAWWFLSTGTDTLVITDIKTTCFCTVTPLESDRIAPGDSMLVHICWDVKKRVGPCGSYPYIHTNDGGRPHRVYMTGSVRRAADTTYPVAFFPHRFELSRLRDISVDSLDFRIVNRSPQEIHITPVSMFVKECEISLPESVAPGKEATGYIKVKEQYLDTEFKRSITVMLDDDQSTRLTIPIRRRIY